MTNDPIDYNTNDVADGLRELRDNAQNLEGENEPAADEVFTGSFMQKYTDFESFDEFFEASPWTVESEDDLEAIPEDEFDEYVNQHTRFGDWEDMYGTAGSEWVSGQLGL